MADDVERDLNMLSRGEVHFEIVVFRLTDRRVTVTLEPDDALDAGISLPFNNWTTKSQEKYC